MLDDGIESTYEKNIYSYSFDFFTKAQRGCSYHASLTKSLCLILTINAQYVHLKHRKKKQSILFHAKWQVKYHISLGFFACHKI